MRLILIAFLLLTSVSAQAEDPAPLKPFSKIWVKGEIIPMNFIWSDMGLTREASFTLPVVEAWKKWVQDNLPTNVEGVEVCSGACGAFHSEWENRAVDAAMALPDSEYSRGVWLALSIHLWRRTGQDGLETIYKWQGRVALLDVKTKRLLGSFWLPLEERRFFQVPDAGMNSALAGQIYRSPLTAFLQLTKGLEKGQHLNKRVLVSVKGHRNVLDALDLLSQLETRGSHLGLTGALWSLSRNEAQFQCFYLGEEKTFTDLLSQLKELKSSHRYALIHESTAPGHAIRMVTE